MIIFGWVTGTNVLACFLSTVGPGIVTIIIFCGINFVLSRRFDLKLMPQLSKTEKRRQIAVRGWKALPALIMPVLILGGIYSGAMTPTEAAAVAVIYALPVGFFVYRGLNLRNAFGFGFKRQNDAVAQNIMNNGPGFRQAWRHLPLKGRKISSPYREPDRL